MNLRIRYTPGATVYAQATITFDKNTPLVTTRISNRVDSALPTSSALSATLLPGDLVSLRWRGVDNGTGVRSYSVYMHDAPSESLFGRNFRAASSGCVRISGIEQLAAWLMTEQGWTPEKVLAMKKSGERQDVRLKKPVPLYFVYITAWATEDGVIQFRRDLYQKDGIGAVASAY